MQDPSLIHFPAGIAKSPTGIAGFDAVTGGGLPRGRPTLVCAGPGCGKTVFSMEFIVRGAVEHAEPGVFVSFEEHGQELTENFTSFGFALDRLSAEGRIALESVQVVREALLPAGDFNLDGLFIRIGATVDRIGARRIVLDGVSTLLSAIDDQRLMRSEFARLLRWIKERGLTAVVTSERGESGLSRHGFEDYVSDCVLTLDQRISAEVATRRLRIVKYRGTAHGSNEYPFLIEREGFTVIPVTEVGLSYSVVRERVSSGVADLDAMLGGGYFRVSTVLVSGHPGTGKSSLAARFAEAACQRGEQVIHFAFEEAADQIVRNMRSVNIDLETPRAQGLLRIVATRPSTFGLEMHLASIFHQIDMFQPRVVVVDPISSFEGVSAPREVHLMTMRLVDFFKSRGITALFTSVVGGQPEADHTAVGISSLIDTWLLVSNLEKNGLRKRGLHVLKSRGMKHSNETGELVLSDEGLHIRDASPPEGGLEER